LYEKNIPEEIRVYKSIHQTYYAGIAGRNEIILNGTTINPNYNLSEIFPNTPSLSCITVFEIRDQKKGMRLFSNQEKLITNIINKD